MYVKCKGMVRRSRRPGCHHVHGAVLVISDREDRDVNAPVFVFNVLELRPRIEPQIFPDRSVHLIGPHGEIVDAWMDSILSLTFGWIQYCAVLNNHAVLSNCGTRSTKSKQDLL